MCGRADGCARWCGGRSIGGEGIERSRLRSCQHPDIEAQQITRRHRLTSITGNHSMTTSYEDDTRSLLSFLENQRRMTYELPDSFEICRYDIVKIEPADNIRFSYSIMADEHIREICNSANELGYRHDQLKGYSESINHFEKEDQHFLFYELIEPISHHALALPSAIRSRVTYSVAHLSHQANLATDHYSDEKHLPNDRQINFKTMEGVAKHWKKYLPIAEALKNLCDDSFINATRNLRDEFHHRFPSKILFGTAKALTRSRQEKNTSYAFRQENPLGMEEVLSALKSQHDAAVKLYIAYTEIVKEHLGAMAGAKQRPQ